MIAGGMATTDVMMTTDDMTTTDELTTADAMTTTDDMTTLVDNSANNRGLTNCCSSYFCNKTDGY
jgi:hypothetical protein